MMKAYVLALVVCLALSEAKSLRNLAQTTEEDSTVATGRAGSILVLKDGKGSAYQNVNTDAFNAIKEELIVYIKKVLEYPWQTVKNAPKPCDEFKEAQVVNDIYAVSETLAKAAASVHSHVKIEGNGMACAKGEGAARAEQCLETLDYCFKHVEIPKDKVDDIFKVLGPDFVTAYSDAASKACTKGGEITAYQKSFTVAFHAQIQNFFSLLFLDSRCTKYQISEVDNSRGHYESNVYGYGNGFGNAFGGGQGVTGTNDDGEKKAEVEEVPNYSGDDTFFDEFKDMWGK